MPSTEDRAQKRYRSLFELSPFTIMSFSKSGFITSCNPAMKNLTGYSPDEVVGKHFLKLDYLGKEAVRYGISLLPSILRGEKPEALDIPFTNRDGLSRWARARIQLIHYPDGRHEILAIVEDITDKKAFEATQTRFMAFKEAATDGFLLLDKDLNIIDANPTWIRRSGLKGDVIGRNAVEVFDRTPELEQRFEVYREVIRTGKAVEFDYVVAPSGNGLIYNVKTFRVGDGLGLIVRDITERVKAVEAQQRLSEALVREKVQLEQAKEVDRLKTEFMNTATHEIRTPITSIQGYTELIYDALASGNYGKTAEYLDIINRNVARLKVLSDDLLDMQRLESGRIELDKQSVFVKHVFEELEHTLFPLFGDKHDKIVCNCDERLRVSCDTVRLNQVLANLVTNAVRYSPEGSEVRINAEAGDGVVVFSVADVGMGLSTDDIAKLFKPFPDIVNHQVRHGSGLGLSISKGIVELHGGDIWVESLGRGKGSTFRFTIPVEG